MSIQTPKVDDRNAPDIAADVCRLLARDLPGMQLDRQGSAAALINVFARFGEIVIDRINRAPNKNFLAFLDLLGISPVPQQAARAPVTFYLAAGRFDSAVVPKGTQVAAEPGKGEQTPVIFETERELVVVSTRLESLFAIYGQSDQYVDYSSVLPQPDLALAGESTVFAPPKPKLQLIPHALYIGLPFPPTLRWVDEVHLRFGLENEGQLDARTVVWEKWHRSPEASPQDPGSLVSAKGKEPPATEPLNPVRDTTGSLSKSGDVAFENLQQWPPVAIDGVSAHWMCCRLQTPISCQAEPNPQTVRETHLPRVTALTVVMRSERKALPPEAAFSNNLKLDLTKDFYPFGERPKFGDTFYLACDEAFSVPDALVTLKVELTNPASGGAEPAIPRVKPRGVRLRWEFWDGESWVELGTSDLSQPEPAKLRIKLLAETEQASSPLEFADTTRAFTETDREVTFRFHRAPQKFAINGQQGFWIRVRIIAGDYGAEAHLAPGPEKTPVLVPSSLAPPSISRIGVSYTLHKEAPAEALLAYNNWQFDQIEPNAPVFRCFAPLSPTDRKPMVYFGFSLPTPLVASSPVPLVTPLVSKALFPARSMSIYAGHAPGGPGQTPPSASAQTSTDWEYWDRSKWAKWTVRDETLGLRRSGLIRFLAPDNFAIGKEFGQERYWLRLRQTDDAFRANLGVVALNTTMATHCVTSTDEILGASNGQPNQRFRTARAPVLEGQTLVVREQTMPSAAERTRIINEEGDDAIQRRAAPAGKGDETWVRWHEVANFYDSQSRDRHYILNRANGEVAFGDGTHGMIPPALAASIRMATYRTGGGVVGNKSSLTIKQLKSAVPYVKSALNWEAADGGADTESEPALLERGPTQIRHGGRAITAQDFEDLAQRVSPEVSRAMCVPLYDLVADPAMHHRKPGVVSLIVVPESSEPKPFPSSDLLLQVESALERLCSSASSLIVLGPDYVAEDVEVIIAVVDPDTVNDVKLGVNLAINRYLHPLTGGLKEAGWDFGRVPQKSEIFKLVESIDGVHHVVDLKLTVTKSTSSASQRDRLLVCAGRVEVSAVLQDDKSED